MSHLSLDSLARLVDEPATPEQENHLAACRECGRLLDELSAQTRALAALPSIAPPAGAWDAIAARLEPEPGCVARRRGTPGALAHTGSRIAAFIRGEHLHEERQRRTFRRATYAAAAITLLFGGGLTQSVLSRSDERTGVGGLGGLGRGGFEVGGIDLASATIASAPLTIDEAKTRLRVAELIYHRALLDYSAFANPIPPRDVVARLATLDAIVQTTGAALERAPADPVINTYHLAALAERTTLLGQIQ